MKQYRKDFEVKEAEFVRRLAEVGVSVASAGFSMADYDGVNDVAVSMEKTETGYRVIASGKTVGFIEFGTGDGVSAHYDVSVPVAWGSWSAEHSQMLWNKGFWYYDNVRYTGTTAYMPMYYAERKMREEAPRIVREVFG